MAKMLSRQKDKEKNMRYNSEKQRGEFEDF